MSTIKRIKAPIFDEIAQGTSALSQGTYEIEKPKSSSMKLYLAGFVLIELASGEVAAPTSPIEPDLESGVIIRKGTAVVIVLRLSLIHI